MIQLFLLDFCQMVQIGFQDVALHLEVSEFTFSNDLDESRCFQLLDVMGKCRCRYGLTLSNVRARNAAGLCAYLLQDVVTARIRQSFGDEANLFVGKRF